jgi:hypothetical protein
MEISKPTSMSSVVREYLTGLPSAVTLNGISPAGEFSPIRLLGISALTLSTRSYKNFHMNLDVRTVSQTRENSPPNPWEVAWVFWHAIGNGTDEMDRTHFYYFVVKTNGLDIGKYDGGTNPDSQQIIAIKYYPLETSIYNKVGEWYNWDIIVLNDHITVKVNNATAFDIINSASFVSGRIGLYNEDSKTEFRNIYIKPIC